MSPKNKNYSEETFQKGRPDQPEESDGLLNSKQDGLRAYNGLDQYSRKNPNGLLRRISLINLGFWLKIVFLMKVVTSSLRLRFPPSSLLSKRNRRVRSVLPLEEAFELCCDDFFELSCTECCNSPSRITIGVDEGTV